VSEKITAIVIAKNAERTIQACLQGLKFCDQIIVGINDSSDKTQSLVQLAGARVETVEWQGYGKTKNRLIDQVEDGWILSIDADEVVTSALAEEILQRIKASPKVNGFWISRNNFFLGHNIKGCGWSPDWQLRLFRRGQGRFQEKEVHEALEVKGQLEHLQAPLDHYSYADLKDYLDRFNRYTSLAACDRLNQGKRFSVLRVVIDPGWTFFKMFFIKRGWRDGFWGFILSLLSAYNTLVKHAKHWELAKSKVR